MRIGIDARELSVQPTGVGRVLEGLLDAWPDDDELLLYSRAPVPWRFLTTQRRAKLLTRWAWLPGAVWEQSLLPWAARRDSVDALFSPAYGVPLALGCGVVAGLHDCASEATPWEFDWRERLRRRWAGRAAARRADYVLVGSRFAAEEVRRWYGTPSSRVAIAPYGVSPRFRPVTAEERERVAREYGIEERAVLFVGAPLERRNLTGIIEVVAELARTRPDLSFCFAGPRRGASARLERTEAARGLGARLRWLGYVPENDLPAVYGAATVMVYPSTYEGFGLPVLEALACGTPVVASMAGSLAEIFAGRAWLVPPNDSRAWSYALAGLLDDEAGRREQLLEAQAWAQARTWDAAARLLHRLLTDAAHKNGR